ncbi:hypothetical protein JYT79_03205 [Cardiobacterium sp. AH-315-I02]|nr:hypothetical protein [Cardiobacterium sp. AH-315-I02]
MNAIPLVQRIVAILWPSFITAGIATILFTTAFDPAVLFDSDISRDISRLGSYTICFFLFWLFGAITSASTCYFLKPCEVLNKTKVKKNPEKNRHDKES